MSQIIDQTCSVSYAAYSKSVAFNEVANYVETAETTVYLCWQCASLLLISRILRFRKNPTIQFTRFYRCLFSNLVTHSSQKQVVKFICRKTCTTLFQFHLYPTFSYHMHVRHQLVLCQSAHGRTYSKM